MEAILQLLIILDSTEPPIWRRVQVPAKINFRELHEVLQVAMGWENLHLYEFNCEGYRIGEILNEPELEGFGSNELLDADTTLITDLIQENSEHFHYTYDFGDFWEHTVVMEKSMPADPAVFYPYCLGGEMSCPPEDSGGIRNYYDYLEILKDRKHPEYNESRIWVGRAFDPLKFEPDKVNRRLRQLKTGM